jgi:hypothetical protein
MSGITLTLLGCLAAGGASSPESPTAYHHIFLPPAVAGTPLSFQIHAEAAYISAYGDMVESMANARNIDADTVKKRIQNSIDAVDAFFRRRELNQEYRKYEINPEAREKRHQERLKRAVDELYQNIVKGGVTPVLNRLLQELAGPVIAYQYATGSEALANSQLDPKLSQDDLKQIRLTDGKTLVFAADDGKVLNAHWPLALLAPEFKELRQQFETTRDAVIHEAGDRDQISYESAQALRKSVVALFVALEAAYPREVRVADFSKFDPYYTSMRFLQGLWGSVQRATTTKDLSVFSGRLRFQGDSLVALLQHMCRSGLEFAPPEPGGEGVYKMLFNGMRNLYMHVGSEKSETGSAQP